MCCGALRAVALFLSSLLSIALLLYFFGYAEKIGVTRFELATSWSQTKRSSQAELHPVIEWTANALWRFAVGYVS